MSVVMVTASGEEHGLINELGNSVQDTGFKHMKPEHRAELEKQKKEDNRIVKARYINKRGSHERLYKPYMKYAGDKIKIYNLIPNQVYDLPMGFIKEVNEKKLTVRAGLVSQDGQNVNRDGTPTKMDSTADSPHELVPIHF